MSGPSYSTFLGTTFTNENIKTEIGNPNLTVYNPISTQIVKADQIRWSMDVLTSSGWQSLVTTPSEQFVQDNGTMHKVMNTGSRDDAQSYNSFSYNETYVAESLGPPDQPLYCTSNFTNTGAQEVLVRFKLSFEGIPFDRIQLQWRDWDKQVNITSIIELLRTEYFTNLQANALVVFNDFNEEEFGFNWAPSSSYFAGVEARVELDPFRLDLSLAFGPVLVLPSKYIGTGWWLDTGTGGSGPVGGDGPPPGGGDDISYEMRNLNVEQVGANVVISWSTTEMVYSRLDWGPTVRYGSYKENRVASLTHSFSLQGGNDIQINTVYYFRAFGFKDGYDDNSLTDLFTYGQTDDALITATPTIFEIYVKWGTHFESFIFLPERYDGGGTRELKVVMRNAEDTMLFDWTLDQYPVVLETIPGSGIPGDDGYIWDHIPFGLVDGWGKMTISLESTDGGSMTLKVFEDNVDGFTRPYTNRHIHYWKETDYDEYQIWDQEWLWEEHEPNQPLPIITWTKTTVVWSEIPVLYFQKKFNKDRIPILEEMQRSRIILAQVQYESSGTIRISKASPTPGFDLYCYQGESKIDRFEARLYRHPFVTTHSKIEGIDFSAWTVGGQPEDYGGELIAMQMAAMALSVLSFATGIGAFAVVGLVLDALVFGMDVWGGQNPSPNYIPPPVDDSYYVEGWENTRSKGVAKTYLTWMAYIDIAQVGLGEGSEVLVHLPVHIDTHVLFEFGQGQCTDFDDEKTYRLHHEYWVPFVISGRDD